MQFHRTQGNQSAIPISTTLQAIPILMSKKCVLFLSAQVFLTLLSPDPQGSGTFGRIRIQDRDGELFIEIPREKVKNT
jgi:hypothetical protein